MKIIQSFLVLLIGIALPVALFLYEQGDFSQPEKKPAQSRSEQSGQEEKKLNEGLQVYQKAYQNAYRAYKQHIAQQWGEFRDAGPGVWVSYEQSDSIRRTVNYQTGAVQVELLVDSGTRIPQVRQQLDKAVFRLMNTTQQEAFSSDIVASQVERSLDGLGDVVQKGELTDKRLFALDDLVSLQMNHDGFIRVSSRPRNIASTDVRPSVKKGKSIVRVSFEIPQTLEKEAAKYAAYVKSAAQKEKIDEELIYAIMETESSFNPMAKSHIPAYGLMQIVPHTAGKDATRYLYGKSKILSPSYLFTPQNNISIGAAYLHVLQYRYMRKVKDPEAREYCAIAAYNAGASNVARAFIKKPSFNKAVRQINKLSSSQVYDKLRSYLPDEESRSYVVKVSKRMQKYQ